MAAIHAAYVDDEAPLLQIAKEFLELEGDLELDTYDVAREAMEALSNRPYDVVVCDYQMPDLDGLSLLRELRREGNHVPFILFTGRGREEVAMEALNLGADRYIQKGGDPRAQFLELKHAVVQLHERMRAEAELERSNRELEVLSRATSDLVGRSDEDAILSTLAGALPMVMDTDIIAVSRMDLQTGRVSAERAYVAGRRVDVTGWPARSLDQEAGGHDLAIRTGRPVLVPEVGSAPGHVCHSMVLAPEDPLMDEGLHEAWLGARSALVVPLVHEGQALGAISVLSARSAAYGERHRWFLESLARSAAAALSLSRLHQEVSRELERRGQAEHQQLLMEAMLEACENGVMIWHMEDGAADIRPVIWNPSAARFLFGDEGESFATLKDCSALLSQDLDALAREAVRLARPVDVLAVREGRPDRQALEITITPLDAEHLGMLIVAR